MSHSCRSSAQRGFTLIEATISMALLLIVLLMSMTLLISMRGFSQSQELVTQPRQTARRALDYLTYYVRGAADFNETAESPNSIVCYYNTSTATTNPLQATYNNITDTDIGDTGTDMITLAVPTWDAKAPFTGTPGPSIPSATAYNINFTAGCGSTADVAANLALFKNLTGAHLEGSTLVSRVLTVVDPSNGAWTYYKITAYPTTSTCSGTGNLGLTSNPTPYLSPPNGAPSVGNPTLNFVQYATFRVKNTQLQQKADIFNPANTAASEDALFNVLLPDVEDLQIAYVYDNGNIYNANATAWSSTNQGGRMGTTFPGTSTVTDVPTQAGPTGTPGAFDVTHVIGLRVSVTARSARIPLSMAPTRNLPFRPASEDRAAQPAPAARTTCYYHYRMTSTILLRNRALGM